MKRTFWGKPKKEVNVTCYTLYVSICKGKKLKWAGECSERIEIDNRLNRYLENNEYVSAKVICKYSFDGHYCQYIEYVRK